MTHLTFIMLPIATVGDTLLFPILSGGLGGAAVLYFLAKIQTK